MTTLETIATSLEGEAAKLRELASTFKADEARLVADLDPSTPSVLVPLVPSPVTLATPMEPAPQEPQPASVTNVHASDGPLPSEVPPQETAGPPPAA